MPTPCPRIRPEIDAVPTQEGDETLYLLYDRSGLSEAQLALSPAALFLVSQFDGQSSLLALQDRFAHESRGTPLPLASLEGLLHALDDALFLDNDRYHAAYKAIHDAFTAAPVRPSTSAGSAYPEHPDALRAELDRMLETAPPPEVEGRATNAPRPAPRGAIVPHIDYERGGDAYAQVYRELAAFGKPEAVLILGTAHAEMTNRFACTRKDFALPGGALPCARDAMERLLTLCAPVADFLTDEFTHRSEHSIELQTPWIRHIWGDVPILPVLVGSMHDFLQTPDAPRAAAADPQLDAFAQAVSTLRREMRLTVLASADLSHIGPRFDHPREVDADFLRETAEADRAYLDTVMRGDATGGLTSLAAHGDAYHVCGAGCIHTLNRILPDVEGRLLGYHQSHEPDMHQAVTYAGVLFE